MQGDDKHNYRIHGDRRKGRDRRKAGDRRGILRWDPLKKERRSGQDRRRANKPEVS